MKKEKAPTVKVSAFLSRKVDGVGFPTLQQEPTYRLSRFHELYNIFVRFSDTINSTGAQQPVNIGPAR
ncbi:hypothetical protein J2S09_002822 [Bacillus fengqiuensis]|nr:hypothetical protein [Bacillus fengqiuensis]